MCRAWVMSLKIAERDIILDFSAKDSVTHFPEMLECSSLAVAYNALKRFCSIDYYNFEK